jgi:hypothetical protein
MAPKVVFTTNNAGTAADLAGVLDFSPLSGANTPSTASLPANGATAVCDADGHLAAIVSPALANGMPAGSGGPVLDLWDVASATPVKLDSLPLPFTGSAGAVAIAWPRIAVAIANGFQVVLVDCSDVHNLKQLAISPMLKVGGLDSVGIASLDDSQGAHCVVYTAASGGILNVGVPQGKVSFAEIDFGTDLAHTAPAMTVRDNLDPVFPTVLNGFPAASIDAKSGFVAIGRVIASNTMNPNVNSPVVLIKSSTHDFAFGSAQSQASLPAIAIGGVAIAGSLTGASPRPVIAVTAMPSTNPNQIRMIEFNVPGLAAPRITPVVPSINQPGYAIDSAELTLMAGTMALGTPATYRIIRMDYSGLPAAPVELPVGGVTPSFGSSIATLAIAQLRDLIPISLPSMLDLGFAKRPTAVDPIAAAIPTKSITLRNPSNQTLNLSLTFDAQPAGSQAFAFSTGAGATAPTLNLSIPSNATKTATVTLVAPFVLGTASGVLRISAGAQFNDSPIALTAVVEDASWTISPLPAAGATSIPFSATPIPICKPVVVPFKINNTSDVTLVVTGVTSGGAFSLVAPPTLPLRISASQATTINVSYSPSGPNANDSATLTLTSDVVPASAAALPASVAITLTGTSAAPPVPQPTFKIESLPIHAQSALGATTHFDDTRANFGRGRRAWISNADPCPASVPFTVRATIGLITRPAGAPPTARPEFDLSTDEVTLAGLAAAGPTGVMLPGPIGAASVSFVLVFWPSAVGDFSAQLTLNSFDSAMNPVGTLVTTLTGTGFEVTDKVAIDLVLDVSGSMNDVVTNVAGTTVTKLQHLQDAVNLFLGMLVPGEGDQAGMITFSPTATTLVHGQPFTTTSSADLTNATTALAAQTSTSIGAGLRQGRDDLNGPAPTVPFVQQRMIVMSDGNENTIPWIEDVITGDKKPLPMTHSIGFGKPADLDDQKLKSMAGRTPFTSVNNPPTADPSTWPTPHGEYRADGDPLELRKLFLFALTDSSRLQTVSDPPGVVTTAQPFLLTAQITNCDYRLFFVVSWESPNDVITLEVVAPDGTVFRNTTLSLANCGRAGKNEMSAWLQLDMLPIDGGGIIGPQQAGKWTLRAVGTQLATGSARCAGVVLVESSLVLDVSHRRTSSTSPVSLNLSLTDDGVAVPSANATITVTPVGVKAPPTSVVLAKLRKAIGRIDSPLNLVDGIISSLTKTTTQKPGTQTVRIVNGAATAVIPLGSPGRYQVAISVTGQACGGTFQRFYQFTESVSPPTGSSTKVTVTPGGNRGGVVVTVVPKTTQGETLGLGHSAGIVPTVSGGSASPVLDRLDGSYLFVIQWDPNSRSKPGLQLHIYGKAVRVPKLPKRAQTPQKQRLRQRK